MIEPADVLTLYGAGVVTGVGITLVWVFLAKRAMLRKSRQKLVRVEVGPEDQFAGELEKLRSKRFSPPTLGRRPDPPRSEVFRSDGSFAGYRNSDGTVTDE